MMQTVEPPRTWERPRPPAEQAEGKQGCEPAWRRPLLARLLGSAVALALLAWLVCTALRGFEAVRAYPWQVRPVLLGCSALCLLVGRCLLPVGVRGVMAAVGRRAPLSLCWRAYCLSQFAKYVPGGVWLFLARAYLYSRYGLAGAAGGVLIGVEQALFVAGSLVVFAVSLPWFPRWSPAAWWWVCPLALAGLLVMLHPRLVSWAYNVVRRRLEGETSEVRVAYRSLVGLLGLYTVFWVIAGFAFCLLVASVTELPVRLWPAVGGMFSGACGAGFLVFVAPAGLGVREGGLAAFLSLVVPFPVAAALALLARLWWFAVDMVFSGASLGLLAALGVRSRAAAGGALEPLAGEGACGNVEEARG